MSLPSSMQQQQQQFASMDPRRLQALEAPLVALTQQCGGDLRNVLYAFFSFLHRRTDFYLVPHEDDLKDGKATMGFREGDAEKLLLVAFRQFPLRRIPSRSQQQLQQQKQQQQQQKKPQSTTSSTKATPAKATELKTESHPPAVAASSGEAKNGATQTSDDADGKNKPASSDKDKKNDTDEIDMSSIRLTEEGLQIPVGNGGSTKRYKWTQTLEECSVLVGIPKGMRGKDLDVTLKKSFISVRSKKPITSSSNSSSSSGKSNEGSSSKDNTCKEQEQPHVFLEGTLVENIVPSESTWSLEGGVLVVVLYKQTKTFWPAILDGDDKIDTSMVDSRRHIQDYDESTQAQIRKIMFDQAQASKGLPTSDQITGTKLEIPSSPSSQKKLPPGVEYIDQDTIDRYANEKNPQKKE